MRVAVIGNTTVNGGFAVAADLDLAGHDVSFTPWPGDEGQLDPLIARGGIQVTGLVERSVAGKGGLARPRLTADAAAAVADADLVILEMPAPMFEVRFAGLLPALRPGQIVFVNTHGYWPALRLAGLLRDAGRTDVTIAESCAPTHAAAVEGGVLRLQWLRGKVPVAVFPADRTAATFDRLRGALPNIRPAANVLETGFAGLNMMIHFPLVLVNIGWCEREEQAGADVPLYQDGMTPSAARLVEAQDGERRRVAHAYGTAWQPLAQYLADYYDARPVSLIEAVSSASYYRNLPSYPAAAWKRWMSWDIPHAHVPFCALAGLAGIDTPLHRAAVSIVSAMLGQDFATTGTTLQRLGLDGMGPQDLQHYVRTGSLA